MKSGIAVSQQLSTGMRWAGAGMPENIQVRCWPVRALGRTLSRAMKLMAVAEYIGLIVLGTALVALGAIVFGLR